MDVPSYLWNMRKMTLFAGNARVIRRNLLPVKILRLDHPPGTHNLLDALHCQRLGRSMSNRLPRLQPLDFRELFCSLPEPILVLLPDFTIAAITDECLALLKIKRDPVVGRNLFQVLPDDSHYLDAEAGSQ